MSDIKTKEVDDFVRKARSKSAPGNDGISYKVFKKCPLLRNVFSYVKTIAERWNIPTKGRRCLWDRAVQTHFFTEY